MYVHKHFSGYEKNVYQANFMFLVEVTGREEKNSAYIFLVWIKETSENSFLLHKFECFFAPSSYIC